MLGNEPTVELYVAHLVEVFREVRRVLRPDGTAWLNLGDSFNAHPGQRKTTDKVGAKQKTNSGSNTVGSRNIPELKPKDLIGVPWRVALALQADGWWLRSDVIWCLSGGAWVYARTQKGDMPIMVKDLVRLDPQTVCLWNGKKWTRVTGWGASNDESYHYEIVLRSGERIGCTGGHRWPTQRGNLEAHDLSVGDIIQSCRLPQPESCERPSFLTDDVLWLIGLYLAEGSRIGKYGKQLSLSADEQHWIPRITAVAKYYGGSCHYTLSEGRLVVRLSGSVLCTIIDTYIGGAVAVDKHLKVVAWQLPDDELRLLIQGYLDGDGHDDDVNERWRLGFCRNYALERDLRTAAARLGATLTLKPCVATLDGSEFPSFRGEWRWYRSGHWNEKDRGEIIEIRSSRARHFWDIAVEDDPHLFALASGVLTHNSKVNAMPESVTDRPTRAHEYIFLLAKTDKYFYDYVAVQTELKNHHGSKTFAYKQTGANLRDVWTLTSQPNADLHYATFPPSLPERCIKAGTSEHGACSRCGAPWSRSVSKLRSGTGSSATKLQAAHQNRDRRGFSHVDTTTTGWHPTCNCADTDVVPCVVLDPFGGAGTTAVAATALRRSTILCEVGKQYAEMTRKRLVKLGGIVRSKIEVKDIQ